MSPGTLRRSGIHSHHRYFLNAHYGAETTAKASGVPSQLGPHHSLFNCPVESGSSHWAFDTQEHLYILSSCVFLFIYLLIYVFIYF